MSQYTFSYQKIKRAQLPLEYQQLFEIADKASESAYAPYSKFKVGAAILKHDGQILTGSNKENAAYPAGLCAERTALGQLNFAKDKVKAIAISYQSEDALLKAPLAPCGICRQSIAEVEDNQHAPIIVLMGGPGDEVIVVNDAKKLLPFAFGNSALPNDED